MWTLEADEALPAWRLREAGPRAVLAFSTRLGGVSRPPFDTLNLGRSTDDDPDAVAENRRRFLTTLGLDPRALATAGQVHGAAVARVTAPGLYADCDVLVTTVPGIVLAVTAADCLPLLLAAPQAVAAAHSGWRGTASLAPAAALGAVCRASPVPPQEVTIHLGPCIRACCYEVGSDVARRFPSDAVSRANGAWRLDLVTAARLQLAAAGAAPHRIHEVAACTACDPSRYFSHRRDGPRTGRHWAVAALVSSDGGLAPKRGPGV